MTGIDRPLASVDTDGRSCPEADPHRVGPNRRVGRKRALPICIAAAGSSQERPFARGVQDVELGWYGVVISGAIIAA
jgi:hypothetical protein